MTSSISRIRNIGIVAHIDAGKTTTTERILYYSGAQHRMGEVDDGTTTTDFDPDEAKRGITIYSAAISCQWQGFDINIIDTPGHVDFTAEVERSLRVLDGAVVVFSAVEGVEAQSETVWRQADRYRVPRICFINKLDRIGADFERTLGQIESRLHGQPIALQIPVGSEHDLRGIIDLVNMQALYFEEASQGKDVRTEPIPESETERTAEWRQRLLDAVAMLDDGAMEYFLENDDLTAEIIIRVLRAATCAGQIQPTLCGSSLDYIGVQPVLDAIVELLPSPADCPPVTGEHPNPGKRDTAEQIRKPADTDPLCCLMFKIQADTHGDMCFARVYSGILESSTRALNARTGKKEFINQLWKIQADSRTKVDSAHAGDIIGIVGPKAAATGDTLCDPQHPVILEAISFPETVISMAVEPESSEDRKKLADALQRLARQDPTFRAEVSEETGQTIISGMGELHLEVLRDRMHRDFNLKIRVHKPRVSYRETIRSAVEHETILERQINQSAQFAGLRVRLEPIDANEPAQAVSRMQSDDVPRALQTAALEALQDEMNAGGPLGFPLTKLRAELMNIEFRDQETSELAVQACMQRVVQEAFQIAQSQLLEPIMKLEVVTPDEFMGNIQADLNARRAIIVSSQPRGHLTAIEAHAPLGQMFGYSTQVRSLSQGRASYSMEPLQYAEAPQSVLDAILG